MDKAILLSFDVEEFDLPLEYGQQIPMEEQLDTGYRGVLAMNEVLDAHGVPATCFTTAHFADNFQGAVRSLAQRHEIASHTYYHSSFKNADLLSSRLRLEEISGATVTGLRMPRLRPVEMSEVKAAGYAYDSSVNPTWLPGRYNNLALPRTAYDDNGVLRIPASVSPLRIPLFWLAFKNLPLNWYVSLAKRALAKDSYLCLYFHPWEFVPLDAYKIPGYTKRMSGARLQERLTRLIRSLSGEGDFMTIRNWIGSQPR